MSQQKTSLGLIFLLYAGGLGAAGQFAKIATIFPEIQTLYPASVVTQGLIMSVIGFLGVIFGIFVGQIVSSLGYRKMLIAGMLLGAAMSFVQAFLPPLPLFLASRMIEGLAHLAIVVAAPTLVTQVTAPNKRYLSMTLWSSFFGVGYALCASAAPFALEIAGPPALFAGHGIYMLVLAGLSFLCLPRLGLERAPLPTLNDVIARHIRVYRSPYQSPAALGWLFYTLTYLALLTVLPPLFPAEHRLALATMLPIVSILSSFTLAATLMRFLSAVTVAQIGFAGGIAAALWMAVFGVSTELAVAIFVVMGLLQSAGFALVPELNKDPQDQALAMGGIAQMGNLGTMSGTPILLFLLSLMGTGAIPLFLALIFAGGLTAHAIAKRLRDRS